MKPIKAIILIFSLLVLSTPALAQVFKHAPKCTIAAGDDQVKTEGGSCGWGTTPTDGDLVILTDATSKTDCGASCPGGSAGGGTVPNLCVYRESISCLEPASGGGTGDMLKSIYDTDNDGVPDQAAELENNPASCTGVEFTKDMDADGTQNCADPLTGRTLDDMPGVNTLLGTTGNIRYSVDEDGVTGHAICYDATDNLTDCGVTPAGGGDVEAMSTSGAAGTAPISDGASGLDMTDVVTQSELDAQATYAEAFQGEMALLQDIGYTAGSYDFSSDANFNMPVLWDTEQLDDADHWVVRAQGSDSSDNWRGDDIVCWEPPHTHYVYVANHCSGGATKSMSYSEGRPCSIPANCQGGSETCDSPDWDASQTPDEITITGHDFGAAGTIYGETVGIERPTGPPVHGSDAAAIVCTPGNLATGERYWIYVEDANTIIPYQDDGDGVAELGTGTPPSGGDDEAMNCTNFREWQGVTIFPQNQSDGSKVVHPLEVSATITYWLEDSTGQNLQCVGGTNHGTACDTEWEQGDQCTGTPAGVCMEVTTPNSIMGLLSWAFPEGIDDSFADWAVGATQAITKHGLYGGANFTTIADDFSPGMCFAIVAYAYDTTDLDTIETYGATLAIAEPRRAGPQRVPCDYAASSAVGAACLHYGHLTNRGAGGNVELDLASFEAGMDFLVTNQTGDTLWIDPNGSERFEAPATDANGDRLRSDDAGDALRIYVPEDGLARVIFNSGGWYDDN